VFLGFLANNDDNQLYLSYMREGAQGAWLTTIRFTPETHDPALLLPVYQLLGKVAHLLGWSNEWVFHLARLAAGVGLLLAVYWFSTICLPAGTLRQSAFLLFGFSSYLDSRLYYYVLLNFEPFWSIVYVEHNVVRTPWPLVLVLDYGLVFVLAIWSLVYWGRERRWSPPRVLVATWFVGNSLLLYAPLAFQGKLMAGWHVGTCMLAAVGLHHGALPWLHKRAWFLRMATRSRDLSATARHAILILTIPSTLLISLIGFRVALLDRHFPYFLPVDDVQAVRWLAAHAGPDEVLLSSYGIGNYWVAHSEGRAFFWHQFAVLDSGGKDRAIRRFYSQAASDRERRDLIETYGITVLFYGALERELGDWDPDKVPWLEPAWRQGATVVYRVRTEPWRVPPRPVVGTGPLRARVAPAWAEAPRPRGKKEPRQ
jgi:hypothetical protein